MSRSVMSVYLVATTYRAVSRSVMSVYLVATTYRAVSRSVYEPRSSS